MWIRKDYDHSSHETGLRARVLVDGEYRWRGRTLCGRTITGISGGSAYGPDCQQCQKVIDRLER